MKTLYSIAFFGAATLAMPAAYAGTSATTSAARSPFLASASDPQLDRWMWAFATAQLQTVAADALGTTVGGLPPPPPLNTTRQSITALNATQLASLRRGIAQMIAWNSAPQGSADFKRSLRYWANMHAYIGTGCSSASGLNYPGMSGLSLQSKATPDQIATWCTCQHGTIQFLTWHRMYLFYFEQVLRQAAGDPNLRLPFWDYETDGHIPPAYRSPTYVDGGVTKPNPLYVANRQAQLNAGTAALSSSVTSTAGAMPASTYSPFNSAIEQTPHGAVHCATGVASCPSGYMGYVPSAGNDPIFYSHHANIDRLYECWLRINPSARLPNNPAQLAAHFSFIDGAGNLVSPMVGNMLTTAQLGYHYAAGGGCPLVIKLPPIHILLETPYHVYPLIGPTILQRGTTVVPLKLAAATRKSLLAAPPRKGGALRSMLVIDGLAYDEPPGVLYNVYVQGPGGKRQLVGVINFFNDTAPRHDDMEGMKGEMADMSTRTFDATDALAALGATGDASLVLEPTTGLTGSTVLKAAQQISPRARVRFSAARIEQR
ncbi:hypothetical protein GCM10009087_25590 [Sphingomonas oligophenolica]|uniref:Tyrosinase family protein n=1 Tax=Sphingomonas oligophenolica TaxID=301154 RepID=A0ABU9Y882_9SPHN